MKRVIFVLFSLTQISLAAQNTMYFMDRLPQKIAYNPALVPEVKFHLGLPALGGIGISAFNSGFNFNELENFIDNLSNSSYDPDEFVHSIGDYNNLNAETSANIFSMGFKLNEKGYFSMGITANSYFNLHAASKVAYLLTDFNDIQDEDFPIRIDEIDFLTNNYLSFGITYSRAINDRLTIGFSPHINFNQLGVKASNLGYIIDFEETEFETDYNETILGEVILGMPTKLNPDAINNNELDMNYGLLPDNWENELSFRDI